MRSKRPSVGNLSALLLGVASAIACVSGSTPQPGDDDDSCEPACSPGLVCQNGACVPPTGTGGSGNGGAASGGVATGGSGATSGGQAPTGGSGGAVATGGISSGGTLGGGGFGNTGGDLPQGGSPTGGIGGSSQGGFPTGGSPTGGVTNGGTGGSGQGGTAGSAGRGGTAGQGGASGSGGTGINIAGFTSCNIGGQHNGDGSYTWYHFSQGTGQENGAYVTACGFRAPTSGTSGTRDTVENIANMSPASASYFVAIPAANPQNFDSSIYCGACVELSGQNGQKVIATVVDMCPISSNPRCSQGAHLDVSKTAFDQLGFQVGDPTGTSWKFVPCPVQGNVKVRMKTGNNNEFFVENGVTSITGVTVNGTMATRTFYGAWHVNSAIAHPASLVLTDKAGRQIPVTLNNSTSNQDTGVQFPRCQ